MISIIIINYNSPHLIARCIQSIYRYIKIDKEVIIVDNNSNEENLDDLLKIYPELRVIRLHENIGFGKANNIGVKNARGDAVFLLNSDIEFFDESINEQIENFLMNRVSAMWGFRLVWPDGSFQNSFSTEISYLDFLLLYTPLSNIFKHRSIMKAHKYTDRIIETMIKVPVLYGADLLLWKNDFVALNGFDKKYFMYYEDIDFCDRFRSTLHGEIFYNPHASIIHNVKGSSNANDKINWIYLKSKYIYGLYKFKYFSVPFIVLDILLLILFKIYKYIKRGFVRGHHK